MWTRICFWSRAFWTKTASINLWQSDVFQGYHHTSQMEVLSGALDASLWHLNCLNVWPDHSGGGLHCVKHFGLNFECRSVWRSQMCFVIVLFLLRSDQPRKQRWLHCAVLFLVLCFCWSALPVLDLCLASALVPEGLLSDLLHVSNGETVDCPSDLLLLDVSVCKALYDSGSRPESLSFA